MAQRFEERVAFTGTVGGTAEAPVVEGVLLCGPTSANRRRYLVEAFAGDRVKRYNGAPVGTYHTDAATGRRYLEEIGLVQNARHRADGMPIGDIHVNPHKPGAQAFLWDAKNQPKACGMSHVAQCEAKRAADGFDEVTEIVSVESVDIIAANGAATTKSLYEQKGRTVPKTTLAKLIESVIPKLPPEKVKPARRFLVTREDDAGMAPVMSAEVDEPAADAKGEDAITAGFKAAFDAIRDKLFAGEMDKKEAFKKLAAIFDGHGEATGSSAPAGKGGSDDDAAEESKRPTLAGLVKECKDLGFSATAEDLGLLADIPTKTARATCIERLKKATEGKGAEEPLAAGRDRTTVAESNQNKGAELAWQD